MKNVYRQIISVFLVFLMLVGNIRMIYAVKEVEEDEGKKITFVEKPSINFSENQSSVVAIRDTFIMNLEINIKNLKQGESKDLTFSPSQDLEWPRINVDTSDSLEVRPTTSGIRIRAKKDIQYKALNIQVPVRIKENIKKNTEEKLITIGLDNEKYHNSIKVDKFKDVVSSDEVVKAVNLGSDKNGDLCWGIYINFNQQRLVGTKENPLEFGMILPSGHKITHPEEMKIYEISKPIVDGERSMKDPIYNSDASIDIQNMVDSKEKKKCVIARFNTVVDKAYYVIFKTERVSNEVKFENNVYLKGLFEKKEILEDFQQTATAVYPSILVEDISAKGEMIIEKTAQNTGEKLSGAVFEIKDSDNHLIKTVETNSQGRIIVNELSYGEYSVQEKQPPKGYELDERIHIMNLNEEHDKVFLELETVEKEMLNFPHQKKEGKMILEVSAKVTGKKLSGAKFAIKDENNQLVKIAETGPQGQVEVENLSYGEYTVQEIEAPKGYELDESIHKTKVDATNNIVSLKVENNLMLVSPPLQEKKGQIIIETVIKGTKEKLLGAKFAIKDENHQLIKIVETGFHGQGKIENLSYGKYTIQEIEAPKGYDLDERTYTVNIEGTQPIARLQIENEKRIVSPPLLVNNGQIIIEKIARDSGEKLSGARFEIKDEKNHLIKTVEIGDNGQVIVDGLADGTYTIQEIKAPIGFELNTTNYQVTVDTEHKIVNVQVDSERILAPPPVIEDFGKITIVKVDADDYTKVLAEAEFDIFDKEGKLIGHVQTDENGCATSEKLSMGAYSLKETKAPQGYKLYELPIQVSIKNQGKNNISKVTIANAKLKLKDKVENIANRQSTNNQRAMLPQTGEAKSKAVIYGIILLAIVIGMIVLRKTKKKKRSKRR